MKNTILENEWHFFHVRFWFQNYFDHTRHTITCDYASSDTSIMLVIDTVIVFKLMKQDTRFVLYSIPPFHNIFGTLTSSNMVLTYKYDLTIHYIPPRRCLHTFMYNQISLYTFTLQSTTINAKAVYEITYSFGCGNMISPTFGATIPCKVCVIHERRFHCCEKRIKKLESPRRETNGWILMLPSAFYRPCGNGEDFTGVMWYEILRIFWLWTI